MKYPPAKLETYIQEALTEADKSALANEVPVGALIVHNGEVISKAHNQTEALKDPTAHAEVLALRSAAKKLGDWRLNECDLFVTLEPCLMCSGAILQSRIKTVIFGAWEDSDESQSSFDLLLDQRHENIPRVIGGILENECQAVLKEFFKNRREKPEGWPSGLRRTLGKRV